MIYDRELANHIARRIFECGSEPSRGPDGFVQRIRFMGGDYEDAETELGGLNQTALARVILEILRENNDGK